MEAGPLFPASTQLIRVAGSSIGVCDARICCIIEGLEHKAPEVEGYSGKGQEPREQLTDGTPTSALPLIYSGWSHESIAFIEASRYGKDTVIKELHNAPRGPQMTFCANLRG